MKQLTFINSLGQEICPGDKVLVVTNSSKRYQYRKGTYIGGRIVEVYIPERKSWNGSVIPAKTVRVCSRLKRIFKLAQ